MFQPARDTDPLFPEARQKKATGLNLDISVISKKQQQKEREVVRFAETRWQKIIGTLDSWSDLIRHVDNTEVRSDAEIAVYRKILRRRLEVNHYRTEPSSRACSRCGQDETIEHLLAKCDTSFEFLKSLGAFLVKEVGLKRSTVSLRDLVYFFPEARDKLDAEKLKLLAIAHSCALVALVEARKYPLFGTSFIEQVFMERYKSRILLEKTESVESTTPSLSRESIHSPVDVFEELNEILLTPDDDFNVEASSNTLDRLISSLY